MSNRKDTGRRVPPQTHAPVEDLPWDDRRFKRLTLLFLSLFILMAVIAALLRLYLVAAAILIFGLALFALLGWSQIRAFWRWLCRRQTN